MTRLPEELHEKLHETRVVLAVLPAGQDQQGRPQFWLERRPDGAHLGGMLAFPGGKCAANELPQDALARELVEELGILPQEPRLLMEIPWVYSVCTHDSGHDLGAQPKHLRLTVYRVDHWHGELHGHEGQSVMPYSLDCKQPDDWIRALPPANRGIVAALCLPPRVAITAACSAGEAGYGRWHRALIKMVDALRQRFGQNSAIVQIRPDRDLSMDQWVAAVHATQAAGFPAWVNADLNTALRCHADGVHLNRHRLASVDKDELRQWQAEGRQVSASGHSFEEVQCANELGVDALLISPVLPTQSHPDASGIGWAGFAELTRAAAMPTYALGGLSDAHLIQVQSLAGQGVAAIRAYWVAR